MTPRGAHQGQEVHLGGRLCALAHHRPPALYQAVGDERGAQSRLDDVTYGQTRNAVASFDLIELVRSGDRPFQITEELEGIGAAEAMAKIMSGREKIAQIVDGSAPCGIELEDVRFRRINYVETVQQKVFERMISERKRIAERSRSEGQGRAADTGRKRRHAGRLVGRLQDRAGGEGRGRRQGHRHLRPRLQQGPELYQFWKAMETLNSSLDEKTWLILSTDSELLKYLKDSGGH